MPEERLYINKEDAYLNSFEDEYLYIHDGRIYTVLFDNIIKKNYICLSGDNEVIKP